MTTIPAIGLGTWLDPQVHDMKVAKHQLTKALAYGLSKGIRHIDTAQIYDTTGVVISAVRSTKVPRKEIIIVTKVQLGQPYSDYVKQTAKALKYIDILLLHHPPKASTPELFKAALAEIWKDLTQFVQQGLVRAVGVSNFYKTHLELLFEMLEANPTFVKPIVNQLEIHLYNQEWDLVQTCQDYKLAVVAHTPLGGVNAPHLLKDPVLLSVGDELKALPAAVALAMQIQRGIGVIPRALESKRVDEYLVATKVHLNTDQIEQLRKMDVGFPTLETSIDAKNHAEMLDEQKESLVMQYVTLLLWWVESAEVKTALLDMFAKFYNDFSKSQSFNIATQTWEPSSEAGPIYMDPYDEEIFSFYAPMLVALADAVNNYPQDPSVVITATMGDTLEPTEAALTEVTIFQKLHPALQ